MAVDELYKNLTIITESILEKRSLERVFDAITKTACTFFNASASSIMLFDKNNEYLKIARSYNLSPEYLKVVKVHKDEEVAGKVCQTKKPRFIKSVIDLFKNVEDDFTVEWANKEGLVSLMCAPLLLKDEPIGCLNIYYRRRKEAFEDLSALDIFTRMAALSIEYSKLIHQSEEKTEILTVLGEVGLHLTSLLDINEIMKVFLSTAILITKSDAGGLILIDEKKQKVVDAYEYSQGADTPARYKSSARLNKGISGEILRTKKPVVISDMSKYNNANPTTVEKKRAAVAGIPLIAREKLIGILYVDSYKPREFTKSEIDYLGILCHQAAIALDNTLLYKTITREAQEMALLYEVSQSFISTLNFDQLLKNILQRLKNTFGYLNLAIMLIDEEKNELYPRSYINYPDRIKNLRFRIGKDGITGHVAGTKHMYYSPDLLKDPYYKSGADEAKSELCFPLMIGDRLIGVLDVESPEYDGFTKDDINMLSGLSAQIAIALDNSQLYEKAKTLSLTDPLTLLPNRRSFDLFIDSETKRAGRYHRPFAVLMIDFDNFKDYNDAFGHPAGDKILQIFSKLMKDTIRDVDFLGRYGGDEFICVLPETDRTFALEVAERMRKIIAAQKIEPNITLSIGIASFPQDSNNKDTIIRLADQACYEAKQLGGNCVNFASEERSKT
jgi:diguanylate cyclase (GGDEF)-like protein